MRTIFRAQREAAAKLIEEKAAEKISRKPLVPDEPITIVSTETVSLLSAVFISIGL